MVACELSRRLHPAEALRCPRCDSADTKFCYFNNYNTSQPRHFCKSCKRYWTAGGSLRNVPVGGGLRKNKKSKLLHQVKDAAASSSSSDELLQKSSLTANAPYAFANNGLQYDSPVPLSFAPPFFMPAAVPSSSPDAALDMNSYPFRSLNSLNYGFLGENRMDNYAGTVDPSLVDSMNLKQQAQCQADHAQKLPEALQRPRNGGSHHPADQAQSHSVCISEAPSEASQASFEVMKDAHTSKSADLLACHSDQMQYPKQKSGKMHRDETVDACVAIGLASAGDQFKIKTQENGIKEAGHREEDQQREVSPAQDDDELGNVVNVRYPYDWEQVSEVLFGGATDFFQLSGY